MTGRTIRRLAPVLALLVFGLGHALRLDAVTLAVGFALVGWLPGLALLRVLRLPMHDTASALGIASAVSIPLGATVTCALALAGAPMGMTLAVIVVLSALLLVALPAVDATDLDPGGSGALAAVAVVAAALVLVMARNPFVRNWSDSWFHVAVFNEVLLRGVPPDFPHMAGVSLPYPWLFHVWLASLAPWLARDPMVLMAGLNVFTALSLPLILYALARSIGMRPGHAVLPGVIFLLGINPWGGALILLRSALGADVGLGMLQQEIADTNTVMGSMALGYHYFDASLWARLGTATAFNYAIVCAGGLVWFAAEVWNRPTLGRITGLVAASAALFMWHTLTAYHLVLGLIGACALGLLAHAREPRTRFRGLGRGALTGLGIALGYALSAPYLRLVTHGAGSGQLMRLALSHENVKGLVIAGGPIALLGVLGLADRRFKDASRSWWLGLLLALLAVFLCFDLPGSAEEKFFYPLMLVLAVWAGGAVATWWPRHVLWRTALLGVAALGVVSTLIVVVAFANDRRPLRVLMEMDPAPGVAFFTPDEDRAITWVRDRSPVRAVFLQGVRSSSNEPILFYGARRLFLGPAKFFFGAIFFPSGDRPPVSQATWSELARRERVQDAVFSTAPLDDATWKELASYPDPLYVWADSAVAPGTLSPTVQADSSRFRPVVRTRQVTVYEVMRGH